MSEQTAPVSGGIAPDADTKKFSGMFVDQSETAVAVLGNNYMQNILLGQTVKQGYAVLTQKRLYYKGTYFSGEGKLKTRTDGECVVPIEDVSMTNFVKAQGPMLQKLTAYFMIVCGIILLLVIAFDMLDRNMKLSEAPIPLIIMCVGIIAAGVVCFFQALQQGQTDFTISFPGGQLRFNVKWYPMADMQDFQRQIHLMREQYVKQ